MSEGRFSAGSVALAFLMGGAVGAGLALLVTPKSGQEAREMIKGQATAAREEALKVADEVKDKANELLEKSREAVEAKKAVLESALEAGKEAMEREKERLIAKMQAEEEESAS